MENFSLESLLSSFKQALAKDKQKRIIKRIPIRPEWQTLMDQVNALSVESVRIERKLRAARSKLWSKIEEDLDEYRNMHWNDGDKMVEVLADEMGDE